MLAYYVHHLGPFIVEFGHGFGIRWYGTAYVLGFLVGYQLLCWMSRRGYSDLKVSEVGDFITGTALFGVLLGGRLGYAFFYQPSLLWHPLDLIRVWEGGMASHGGILGIILYTLWYAKRHKLAWTGLGDNLVVAAPIGIFFGRCANFINGELFGRAASVPWAMQFPKELFDNPEMGQRATVECMSRIDPQLNSVDLVVEASRTSQPVRELLSHILTPRHPSQLYEAAMEGLALFVALWFLRTRTRMPQGVVTGAFFILYACFRIFGEQFREPDIGIPFTLGLTRGQFLSLFMIVIGAAFVIVGYKRNKPSPRPG